MHRHSTFKAEDDSTPYLNGEGGYPTDNQWVCYYWNGACGLAAQMTPVKSVRLEDDLAQIGKGRESYRSYLLIVPIFGSSCILYWPVSRLYVDVSIWKLRYIV